VLARLVPLLLLTGLMVGCGDDPGDPERTVRDFAKATSTRDVDAICGRLLTQDFLERTTGGVGEGAQRACRGQLRGARVVKTRVVRVEESDVDGDRARVRVVLATEGQRRPRTFRLVDEDGEWKIAGAVGG
jgi:Domain of unknown function (DUF4878)